MAATKKAAPKAEETIEHVEGIGEVVVTKEKPSSYKAYEKWRVEVKREEMDNPRNPMQRITVITGFKAFEKLRNCKIEESVADSLNEQSHNSGIRYYKAGTVTGGDFENAQLSTY